MDAALQNALLIVGLVAQASVRACHCMMRSSTADAMTHILRLIYLYVRLSLKVLARHVPRVLLRAVGEGHLVDRPTGVLHAHIVGRILRLSTLMAAAFHGEARL